MVTIGSTLIEINGKNRLFHVVENKLPIVANGILGADYCEADKREISFYHRTIVTDHNPMRPIPFLNPGPLKEGSQRDRNITAPSASKMPKTRVYCLSARTRQVVPVEVTNPDIREGYLPLLDAGDDLFIGNALVSVKNGYCHVLAINTSSEDINIETEP